MIKVDHDRFGRAASAFLEHFSLPAAPSTDLAALESLYRAFSRLPYENVSKIIRYRGESSSERPVFRGPEEVIEDFLDHRLGGTCFSLTHCLKVLLSFCGFEAYRVMGDMRHGPNIHCAVVVRLEDGRYLCDAGYLFPAPLRMAPGGQSVLKGPLYTYILQSGPQESGVYYLYTRSPEGITKRRYRIRDFPVSDRDFERHWLNSFEAPMNSQLLLTRNTDLGQVYVHKHHLRLSGPEGKTNRNIRLHLAESIEDLFGIDRHLVDEATALLESSRKSGAER